MKHDTPERNLRLAICAAGVAITWRSNKIADFSLRAGRRRLI